LSSATLRQRCPHYAPWALASASSSSSSSKSLLEHLSQTEQWQPQIANLQALPSRQHLIPLSLSPEVCSPPNFPLVSKPSNLLIPGATELPSTNLTLQFVAIGRGIQNYTCSGAGAVPVQQGAIATLYDATALARTNTALLHTIPAIVVYRPKPSGYMAVSGQHFSVLGDHFFDSASTPTFNLTTIKPFQTAFVAKTLGVSAPAGASAGPAGTGAVAWLDLNHKAGYPSIGPSQVYRVVTAGGMNYPTCTDASLQSIQYAAEYWFYS
jgi:hypothetical protein